MVNRLLLIVVGLILVTTTSSCTSGDSSSDMASVSSADGSIVLTGEEMQRASGIFFDTCAGCHGTGRLGATGPALLPENRTSLLTTAGLKAFIVNRVGDFGFLLGIAAVLYVFGSLDYVEVFGQAPGIAALKP